MSRPTVKVIRQDDRAPPANASFEVWNGSYESMASLNHGLRRQTKLAEAVRMMWVQRDPTLSSLNDAPESVADDHTEWAEFRVSVWAKRVYETRNFDLQVWKKAMNKTAAIETICNEVGYVPP